MVGDSVTNPNLGNPMKFSDPQIPIFKNLLVLLLLVPLVDVDAQVESKFGYKKNLIWFTVSLFCTIITMKDYI
jgi:hypothetical protein